MKTIIVDVRTEAEFKFDGHAECIVNYPLNKIESYVDNLHRFEK